MSQEHPAAGLPLPPTALAAEPPAELQEAAGRWLERIGEADPAAGALLGGHAALRAALVPLLACSDFAGRALCRRPGLLGDLLDSGDLLAAYRPDGYRTRLAVPLAGIPGDDEAAMMRALRRFREREMLRIAWRDLAGWVPTGETLRDLTRLAEACVQAALDFEHARGVERHGTPRGPGGEEQRAVVLGMGKLGGHELNFSSDIDLILAFPEEGVTDGARQIANSQFFARVGQGLVRLLNETTADGFVFRVDLRLRPWGDAGPVAISFGALEDYYQLHGREWERYALIKARAIAGDPEQGRVLERMLRPFVYRRYLDYSAFASLREMKALIAEQVKRKGLQDNIKLGPGGIREIEFVGQAFQLIRGGRESALRERGILAVLERLGAAGHLDPDVVAELEAAYDFLRRVENRLQMAGDQQTHGLPREPLGRARLAYAMGFTGWEELLAALDRHRAVVHRHFNAIFTVPGEEDTDAGREDPLWRLWRGLEARERGLAALAAAGFEDPERAARALEKLRGSGAVRLLSEPGRERLDRLVPLLVSTVGAAPEPDQTLERVLHLVETVARRTVYLALLEESPVVLEQLVRLCSASPWIASLLTRHPILLDELIDPRTLYAPPGREALEAELAEALAGVDGGDVELQMDVLRQFKQGAVLRVAAADITGHLPLMRVSDHLTMIAEVVLAAVLRLAEAHLAVRHGYPRCRDEGGERRPGFAVVGYGKLGGLELGYGSDLDLVFLHDSRGQAQVTDGERPLDNPVYYARLAQRIIHLLTTLTSAGVLYEVDMRLRPDGNAGLLVAGIDGYAQYQREKAWTWEHQALVRARAVAGAPDLCAAFEAVRGEVLCRRRDPQAVRREVCQMRTRMREHLGSTDPARFHLKQDAGGIADIEFMVQYAALAWAADHPELVRWSDNIRQLEALARCGLLSEGSAELLTDAYRAYRERTHQLALQEQEPLVPADELGGYRDTVQGIWRELMEPPERSQDPATP